MRLIGTGSVLMLAGVLGVPATIVWMVLAFDRLKAAGGNPSPGMLSHDISVALAISVVAALLFIAGLVVLILGIIKRKNLGSASPAVN